MKKSFVFLSVVFIIISLKSQILQDWTQPVALTDSTSDNSNPVIVVWQDELYMIYNKYEGPYRQVWWRKISEPMTEEQMLFGVWPELDYRNPQMLFNNFLILEINVFDGEYDIFGAKMDTNGLVGDFFRLTNTPYDENSFFGYNSYSEICCWEGEGNIYIAEPQISEDTLILSDIELIDTGNCCNPVCQEGYVAWEKIENNETHIYFSEKNYPTYQWSDPAPILDTGSNINLALSISVPELCGWGYNICWQSENKIYSSYLDGGYISSTEIPGIEHYYEPVAFNICWVTDYISDLYSFVGETDSVRDIYIVDEYVSGYVLNITEDTYFNKNPRLFLGRNVFGYDDFEIINIWQTVINGHDVLYYSYARYNVVIGNVDKNEISNLKIFPDPVSDQMTIQINLKGSAIPSCEISILNNYGIIVDEIKIGNQVLHGNKLTWNKGNLSAGIYYLVVKTNNEIMTEKFIIL
jgi:hypothetical protein